MTNDMYAIFDSVAGFYSPIFTANNDAVAIRMMQSSIPMEHKTDYVLYMLGQFDNATGEIKHQQPKPIFHGSNFEEPNQ